LNPPPDSSAKIDQVIVPPPGSLEVAVRPIAVSTAAPSATVWTPG
jgi:hypothetical protein